MWKFHPCLPGEIQSQRQGPSLGGGGRGRTQTYCSDPKWRQRGESQAAGADPRSSGPGFWGARTESLEAQVLCFTPSSSAQFFFPRLEWSWSSSDWLCSSTQRDKAGEDTTVSNGGTFKVAPEEDAAMGNTTGHSSVEAICRIRVGNEFYKPSPLEFQLQFLLFCAL